MALSAELYALAEITAYQISLLKGRFRPSSVQQNEEKVIAHLIRQARKCEKNYPRWLLELFLLALPYSSQMWFFDSVLTRGYAFYTLARKGMIRQMIIEAMEQGVEQVVFVDSGYDPIGFVLANNEHYQGVNFFDLNQGEIFNTKKNALSSLPAGIPFPSLNKTDKTGNYRLIERRFDLNSTLVENGFKPHQNSFFVLEDMALSLTVEQVEHLLLELKMMMREGDRCLISFGTHFNEPAQAHPPVSKSSIFSIASHQVISFATQYGFTVSRKAHPWGLLESLKEKSIVRNEYAKPLPEFYVELTRNTAESLEEENVNSWESIIEIPLAVTSGVAEKPSLTK